MKNAAASAHHQARAPLTPAPLWERPELRRVAGDTLRPGALELTERAATLAGLHSGWRVLDVGAGLGATTAHLRRRHGALAVGVEPSAEQLARRVSPQVPMLRARAETLPVANESQNMALCECVLSLVAHPRQALAELARVLAPGGWLALSDLYLNEYAPQTKGSDATGAANPDNTVTKDAPPQASAASPTCAHSDFTAPGIERLVRSAGLEVVHFEDHTRLLKDLAARLILAGAAPCGESSARHGYFLLMARKPETPHA